MEISDYLPHAAILISLASFFFAFRESVHNKRQRRLLVLFTFKEELSGWGDDIETAWCRIAITVENRSTEDYMFDTIRVEGISHFGLQTAADTFGKGEPTRRTIHHMKELVTAKSDRVFYLWFGFPRKIAGGSVSFSVSAAFELASPRQGLDFLNLSARRSYMTIAHLRYMAASEITIEATDRVVESQSDISVS